MSSLFASSLARMEASFAEVRPIDVDTKAATASTVGSDALMHKTVDSLSTSATGTVKKNTTNQISNDEIYNAISTSNSSTLGTSDRIVTWLELAKHDSVNDTQWTCIDGLVYDITKFKKIHPGGTVIRLADGRDSTSLFESYHSLKSLKKVNITLKNKCPLIGSIENKDQVQVKQDKKKFFNTVKQRVEQHLQANHLSNHHYAYIGITETILTLLVYAVTTIGVSCYGSLLCTVILGLCTARLGFFMHTGNHCGISDNKIVNQLIGFTMDVIGSNNLIWGYEHQVAHHGNPNEEGKDNDCEIGNPFIRMHPHLPHNKVQTFQHITVPIAISFGFMKWFVTDFTHLWSGTIGNLQIHATKQDWIQLLIFKSIWFFLHFVLSVSCIGIGKTFLLAVIWLGIGAHYLENTFIVNHIQHGLVPRPDEHWSTKQVLATSNWHSKSNFYNWLSGGLNHQIEHHLFPAMSIYLYPQISDIVKQTCKDHDLPYYNYPTFTSAWIDMWKYLRAMGQKNFKDEDFKSLLSQKKNV